MSPRFSQCIFILLNCMFAVTFASVTSMCRSVVTANSNLSPSGATTHNPTVHLVFKKAFVFDKLGQQLWTFQNATQPNDNCAKKKDDCLKQLQESKLIMHTEQNLINFHFKYMKDGKMVDSTKNIKKFVCGILSPSPRKIFDGNIQTNMEFHCFDIAGGTEIKVNQAVTKKIPLKCP